jgi:leader peptidase (prepilin peptidase)/N-methyltransferase
MGFGDVKLAFNLGFLLGVKAGLLALYFGFVLGGIVGLILLLLRKKKLKSKIAFGPFLVLGMLIMLFWQKEVFQLVNKIYGF